MKSSIQSLAAFALLQFCAAAPAAEPANRPGIEARGECTLGVVCGEVRNDKNSNSILKVTNDWGKRDKGAFKWISPGYTSATAMKDADGFFVESFCKATSGSKTWASAPCYAAVVWKLDGSFRLRPFFYVAE